MPINIDRELVIKLLPILIIFIGGLITYYVGKATSPKNYPIQSFEEFTINVSGEFDIEKIKELHRINREEFREILFSHPQKIEIPVEETKIQENKDKEIEVHLTLIINSNNRRFCRINGRLMGEDDISDGFKVKKITEAGVLLETDKGLFFVRNGEKKII